MSTGVENHTHEQTTETAEFSYSTLRRYYGEATPYGTLPKITTTTEASVTEAEGDDTEVLFAQQNQSSTLGRSPTRTATSTTGTIRSTASYGTTLRRSKGGFYTRSPEPEILLHNVAYKDFMPKKKKEGFAASKRYHGFSSCVEEANKFLEQNQSVKLRSCESLYVRLDHNHRVNPESMTSHDRSYVIGLRLWYIFEEGEDSVFVSAGATEHHTDAAGTTSLDHNSDRNSIQGRQSPRESQRLCYRNVLPDCINSSGNKTIPTRHKGRPAFEDLKAAVNKLNGNLAKNRLPGQLISVETIPINYYHAFRDDKELDPDYGYWCLDYHGKWNFFLIRIFYLEGNQQKMDYEINFEDFAPESNDVVAKCPSIDSLTQRASKWLYDEESARLLGSQTVEIPFNPKKRDRQRKISTSCSSYETSKISAFLHTTRVLRLWFMRFKFASPHAPSPSPSHQSTSSENWQTRRLMRPGIAVRNFLPCQVTTTGCCGIRKPMFATTEDTSDRIREWISLTGADVICIQTDNVEKWSGEQCKVGNALATKLYNKQDFSRSVIANSLEYRLTVLRVFIRADQHGVFQEPDTKEHFRSPTPVEPCCCFVGCNVM